MTERPSWAAAELDRCEFSLRGYQGPAPLCCAVQEHGTRVHVVKSGSMPTRGDGLWTQTPELLIGVRVADCVPILLWDPSAQAVAAVHAGWRGTAGNIVGEALRRGAKLGVKPANTRAAIGPCIEACCFEVGAEVIGALREIGLTDLEICARTGPRGKPHIDLRRCNRALLRRAGLQDTYIEDVGGCTRCHPKRYESYRRDGPASGRMWGMIALGRRLASLLLGLLLLHGCTAAEFSAEQFANQAEIIEDLIEQGQLITAEELTRELLEQRPDDALLRGQLGRILHLEQRYQAARVQDRLALGLDPQLWQAAYNLACSSAALGDLDAAIRWLQPVVREGHKTVAEVAGDPDLQALHDDHRFSFYLATGLLSKDERDALALVQPKRLRVGEMATLSVTAIALNRPLMAPREQVRLRPEGPFPEDLIRPLSRRETFSSGEHGDREFAQRTFQFSFQVLKAGKLTLGPFEIRQGDSVQWTRGLTLEVMAGASTDANGQQANTVAAAPLATAEFFTSPAEGDQLLRSRHLKGGGELHSLDALAETATEAAWQHIGQLESRYFEFRALSIEELPAALPAREPGIFRSILVQRGTEGISHVAELRRRTADQL